MKLMILESGAKAKTVKKYLGKGWDYPPFAKIFLNRLCFSTGLINFILLSPHLVNYLASTVVNGRRILPV